MNNSGSRADALGLISGRGLPLPGNDIDTDRILPARFLKSPTFEGLEVHVFADDRRQGSGGHPLNRPEYAGASILVVGANFGCGSSREHAPEALRRWGVRAIVGVSFGEIFVGNCTAIGVPCAAAATADIEWLQASLATAPQQGLDFDLERSELRFADRVVMLTMAEAARRQLLDGTWNATGVLLQSTERIRAVAASLPYVCSYR